MSCHAILKNLYEPKMDVILTANFKVTAEIEWRFVKHNYVLSFIHCLECVYIVLLVLIAWLMRLDHL